MKRTTKKLYVAYGSNLHLEQMHYRCPDAKVFGTGVLKNHSLTFWGNWNRNGVATVLPDADTDVPVAVWEISERDEQNLDRYEGWPHLYRKENIEVEMSDGTIITCMIYLMNKKFPGSRVSMKAVSPSDGYYNTIAAGYRSFGFDINFLKQALTNTLRESVLQDGNYRFSEIR